MNCPACGSKVPEFGQGFHAPNCPLSYADGVGVELPDGSFGVNGHEVELFTRGADWARDHIVEEILKVASSSDDPKLVNLLGQVAAKIQGGQW